MDLRCRANRNLKLRKAASFAYSHTEPGKADLAHFTGKLIALRKDKGDSCRVSKKQIEEWIGTKPAAVTPSNTDATELVEPDDIWVTEMDHETEFGSKPTVQGIVCVWVERPNGNKQQVWIPEGRQRSSEEKAQ